MTRSPLFFFAPVVGAGILLAASACSESESEDNRVAAAAPRK